MFHSMVHQSDESLRQPRDELAMDEAFETHSKESAGGL
jgi:hypothetical protein